VRVNITCFRQLLSDCGIGVMDTATDDVAPAVNQHRVLIFCQLKSMLDMVEHDLFQYVLVHGKVTIIFVVSVCLFVYLFVQSFLSRLRSDLDQTRTHVTCPRLVVSPRIWGLGDPQKTCIFRCFGAAENHHSVAASSTYTAF